MEILTQLGANQTAFIQFAMFVITISFLTLFVYNPYFKAYDERLKQTKGADAVAKDTAEEAKNLAQIYQAKAREINDKIRSVFEAKRSEAGKTTTEILTTAKTEAEATTNKARVEIENQKKNAQTQVQTLSQEIAAQLQQKFEGGL